MLPDSKVDAVKKKLGNPITVITRKVPIMNIHPEYKTDNLCMLNRTSNFKKVSLFKFWMNDNV